MKQSKIDNQAQISSDYQQLIVDYGLSCYNTQPPSLSAFKTKRESCDSLFLCLIANALYLQRSDYGERERFIT